MSFVDERITEDSADPANSADPAGSASATPPENAGALRPASASQAAGHAVNVKTEQFNGPFDLLLHLILKHEVDLYEISLSEIVDAYLAELDSMELCDLETATEFLLIAATLVELKCRRLLPVDDSIDLDDELGLWEERDLLLSRLLECKTFKDAAKAFEMLTDLASRSVPRRAGMEDAFLDLTPDLLIGVTGEKLRKAFLRVATAKPEPTVDLFHVTSVKASVSDAIAEMMRDLPQKGRVSFRSMTVGLTERLEVVVRFLAVLELFKQGMVELDQPAAFGDLTVEWITGAELDREALAGFDLYEG